jgi:hypothetical protein
MCTHNLATSCRCICTRGLGRCSGRLGVAAASGRLRMCCRGREIMITPPSQHVHESRFTSAGAAAESSSAGESLAPWHWPPPGNKTLALRLFLPWSGHWQLSSFRFRKFRLLKRVAQAMPLSHLLRDPATVAAAARRLGVPVTPATRSPRLAGPLRHLRNACAKIRIWLFPRSKDGRLCQGIQERIRRRTEGTVSVCC